MTPIQLAGAVCYWWQTHTASRECVCTCKAKWPSIICDIGAPCVPPGPKDFATGDKVKVDVDMEVLTSAMEGSGARDGIVEQMLVVIH